MRVPCGVLVSSILAFSVFVAGEQPKASPAAKSPSLPIQQLVELTQPDGAQDSFFGQSVAIAGDTIAVSSYRNINGQGAVYVYVKPASGWKDATLTAELTIAGYTGILPSPVAISPDGNTIVVNGGYATTAYPQIFVYVKPAGGWVSMTQTAALHATLGGNYDFGFSLATDGENVLVGSLGCSGDGDFSPGAAYLFVKPAGGWTDMSQTGFLKETDPIGCDDYGSSVALVAGTAVAGRTGGGMTPPVAPGRVYVFTEPTSGWATMGQTAKLTGQTNSLGDGLGSAVVVNGNTILSRVPYMPGTNSSGIYVYSQPSGGWANATQTAVLTNTNHGVTSIGSGIALDGSTVAVIANYHGGTSRALTLYYEPAGGWQNATTPNVTFFPSDQAANDAFGEGALAISGGIIVAGSSAATRDGNSREGAVYIFQQN